MQSCHEASNPGKMTNTSIGTSKYEDREEENIIQSCLGEGRWGVIHKIIFEGDCSYTEYYSMTMNYPEKLIEKEGLSKFQS